MKQLVEDIAKASTSTEQVIRRIIGAEANDTVTPA